MRSELAFGNPVKNMKLKCIAEECIWESQDLNEGLAEKTLLMHLQLVHQVAPAQPQVGGTGLKKPEGQVLENRQIILHPQNLIHIQNEYTHRTTKTGGIYISEMKTIYFLY